MKDLSGDGKITQKDVLIGRGVIDKKKMKGGGLANMMRGMGGMGGPGGMGGGMGGLPPGFK